MAAFFADPSVPPTTAVAEINLQRRDGRLIPVGFSCSPLRQADGTAAGLVAIFQDLTERKRVEEQLRRADRLAALGQLAANIAHEVRNPLAAISGPWSFSATTSPPPDPIASFWTCCWARRTA